MDFLLWTCLVLGLLGAISLALSGLGVHEGHSHLPGDHAPHQLGGHHLPDHHVGHHVPHGGHHVGVGHPGEHHLPGALGGHHGPMPDLAHLVHADHLPSIAHAAERLAATHHGHDGIPQAVLAGRVQSTELTQLSEALNRVRSSPTPSFDEPAPAMSPFSSFSIFGFLSTFGLVGLAMRYSNPLFSQGLILSVSTLSATVVGWMLWKVLDRFLKFVEHDSVLTDRDIVGALAEATMPIAPDAVGEVRIAAAGRHLTGPARNTTGARLERREKVRIAGRAEGLYVVEALTAADLEFLAALSALDATLAGHPPPPVAERPPESPAQEESGVRHDPPSTA